MQKPPSNPLHSAFSATIALACFAVLVEGNLLMTRTFCVLFGAAMLAFGILISDRVRRFGARLEQEFFKAREDSKPESKPVEKPFKGNGD